MRIALCSNEVAGVRGGGIGTYVVEAARALAAGGHEVWLVTSDAGASAASLAKLEQDPALHRVVFVERTEAARTLPQFGLARRPLWFAQLVHEALQAAGVPFDYIEFPDYEAFGAVAVPEQRLLGSYGDAVVAVVLHSPTHECWEYNECLHLLPASERETAVLEEETIRLAPVVWSPSTRLGEMVEQRLGLERRIDATIRYPMRLDALDLDAEDLDAGDLDAGAVRTPGPKRRLEDLKFLFFGRIEPRKGVRQLVDAFARMPELSIDCIGRDGDTSPTQTSEVAWLRRRGVDNVRFVEPLPREQMLQRLREADVVLLPSPWENWPNTCIEAMAAGRVVIGGRNGGMGEMIEHGDSGFVVDGSDPDDIVRVVQNDLRAALPRLDAIGAAAARRIRELSAPARYVAEIEQLVERHRGRGRLPAVTAGGDAPRVSVVVPFYREDPDVVGAAVGSALAQRRAVHEVVVVEDGSPRADKDEILRGLATRDPRVRVLHKPNGGLSSARNFAIERIESELLLFLDADNLLRPDYTELAVDVLQRRPHAIAAMPRISMFVPGERRPRNVVHWLPYDRPLALFRNSLGDAGALVRRELFHEHGLRYDPAVDVYSDWALWLDVAARGLEVVRVPRVLYDYRLRADSLMHEHAWDRHLAMLGVLIDKHLPPAKHDREDRATLLLLKEAWGIGALLGLLGGRPENWERPAVAAKRLRADSMRYRLADGLGALGDRLPPLRRLAHWTLLRLSRAHGRFKDWRRGGGPA